MKDVFDFTWTVGKIFPSVIMFMYMASMGVYSYQGNYQQAFYWFSAFCITFSVTWMRFK